MGRALCLCRCNALVPVTSIIPYNIPPLELRDVGRDHLESANAAVKSLGGKVWPAQNDCEATGVTGEENVRIKSSVGSGDCGSSRFKYLHDGLGSDPLDLLSPAGALGLASDGQALEWVRLERPGHVAHCAHHRELPGSLGLVGGTDGGAGDDGRHIGLCWRAARKDRECPCMTSELSLCAS